VLKYFSFCIRASYDKALVTKPVGFYSLMFYRFLGSVDLPTQLLKSGFKT
jgi:hypothetical protein